MQQVLLLARRHCHPPVGQAALQLLQPRMRRLEAQPFFRWAAGQVCIPDCDVRRGFEVSRSSDNDWRRGNDFIAKAANSAGCWRCRSCQEPDHRPEGVQRSQPCQSLLGRCSYPPWLARVQQRGEWVSEWVHCEHGFARRWWGYHPRLQVKQMGLWKQASKFPNDQLWPLIFS